MIKGFIEVTEQVKKDHRGISLRPLTINTDHIVSFTGGRVTIVGVGEIFVEESYETLHSLVQEARAAGRPRKATKNG